MPNLNNNNSQRRKAKFTTSSNAGQKPTKADSSAPSEDTGAKSKSNEDTSLDDEIIASSSTNKGKVLVFGGVAVVIVLIATVALLFGSSKSNNSATPINDPTQQDSTVQSSSNNTHKIEMESNEATSQESNTQQSNTPSEDNPDEGIGIQDFTANTNNRTSDTIQDGDEVLKDLYGLSMQVAYDVDSIYNATDFVTYTKARGTWGGGLEFYYLDAEYKGRKYVVQVPFKYYKELDDIGTVPVKIEVLHISGTTEEDDRTVISYMTLDEEVLETVMKSSKKSR